MFRRVLMFAFVLLAMLCVALPAFAQLGEVLYGVVDNRLVAVQDGQSQVIAEGAQRYGELVASPDGKYLAFAAYNANDARSLDVYDRTTGEIIPIASGLSAGMPFSFTQMNELVYALDGEFVVGSDGSGVMQSEVYVQPLPITDAPTIIPIEFGVGCGGGSPLPTDQLYSSETYSLGGNHLMLALTPFGLVYSTDCQGINLAVRSLDGQNLTTIDGMTRAVLSPDETRIAAIPFVLGEATPLVVRILDLTTNTVSDIPIDAVPDQLAWNESGSGVYYSVRAFDTLLNYDGEARSRIDAVLDEGTPLERWAVSLFEVNVTSDIGRSSMVFNGDGFAIARISRGAQGVYLSVVPNIDAWSNAIADGSFDPFTATGAEAAGLMPITVWRADITDTNVDIAPVGSDLRSFAVITPRG
jgi:hypothetical protein